MTGFHYLLVLAGGEPADPGVFVTNEPPGLWKIGDEFIARGLERFRILDIRRPDENGGEAAWTAEYQAIWTVEPVSAG